MSENQDSESFTRFNAHRCVVDCRSPVLRLLLAWEGQRHNSPLSGGGSWLGMGLGLQQGRVEGEVGGKGEGDKSLYEKVRSVSIMDCDSAAFASLLVYMYTGDDKLFECVFV